MYGLDISPTSVAYARRLNKKALGKRCFIEEGSATSLPWEAGKFDLVTAFETVYFWPDLDAAFGEVARVLKPGGDFVFTYGDRSSPAMAFWERVVDGMKMVPMADLKLMLARAGFKQVTTTGCGVNIIVHASL